MNLSYHLGINFEHKGREVDFTVCGYPCPRNTTCTRASRRSTRWLFAQALRSVLRPLPQCQPPRATSFCATRWHHTAGHVPGHGQTNAPHLVPCSDHPARTQRPASAPSGAREAPEKQKPSEKGDGWQPPEQPRHMQLVLRRTECHPRHTFCLSGDSLVTRSCCLCPRSLSGLWRDRSREITQIATMTCKDSLAD